MKTTSGIAASQRGGFFLKEIFVKIMLLKITDRLIERFCDGACVMKTLTKKIKVLYHDRWISPYCNCLLIDDGIQCLVDASPPPEERVHLDGKNFDLILNSHGHMDHYSLNYRYPDARVLLHPADNLIVESGEEYIKSFGFDVFGETEVRPHYLEAMQYHPRKPDGPLEDGKIISTGSVDIEVVHLPGHNSAHCGFLFLKEGFLFSADLDLDRWGPWYGSMDSSAQEFIDSINRVMKMNIGTLVVGHNEPVVDADINRRLAEYRDIIYTREKRIVEILYSGRHTIKDIAAEKPVYRNFMQPVSLFFIHECGNVMNHLKRLEALGVVESENERYYLKDGIRPHSFDPGR